MDISIIMPVYNSEKFLVSAIESILNQTHKNFELLLINDGSTDNSRKICDDFAVKDQRVIVLHKENGGISDARNLGLQNAKGKYIAFADNDDLFSKELLEDNFKLAEKHKADIVKYGVDYVEISKKETKNIKIRNLPLQVMSLNEISKRYLELKKNNIFVYVWDSLIRRDIIKENEIYFDKAFKYGGEDIDFNFECFKHVNTLVINPIQYYHHFKRHDHSTVFKFSPEKLTPFVLNAKKENIFINEINVKRDYELINECTSSYIIQISYTLNHINEMDKSQKIRYLKELNIYNIFEFKPTFLVLLKSLLVSPKRALINFLYNNSFYKTLLKICA